jgi:hypothetical protein
VADMVVVGNNSSRESDAVGMPFVTDKSLELRWNSVNTDQQIVGIF